MQQRQVQSQRDNNEGRKSSSRVCVQGQPCYDAGQGEPEGVDLDRFAGVSSAEGSLP